jgi:hypothetical protein
MVHSKSLRVIGQLLETVAVPSFELERHGLYYLTWSPFLLNARDLSVKNGLAENIIEAGAPRWKADSCLCFSSFDISRLDAQARKSRRNRVSSNLQGSSKMSQLLRTLGDQFDRIEAGAFQIFWSETSVSTVVLPVGDLVVERKTVTFEELQQLCVQRRLRRQSPQLAPR